VITLALTIKLVIHDSGKAVVNMPGSGMNPRVYTSVDKALAKVSELAKQ
jgi:hypothetical protein